MCSVVHPPEWRPLVGEADALGAVRAALEGKLAGACRVCFSPCAGADLSAELPLRSGVYSLREILARVTHSEVEQDCALSNRLCDNCLSSCLTAFDLIGTYRRSTLLLERCLHFLTRYIDDNQDAIHRDGKMVIAVPCDVFLRDGAHVATAPLLQTEPELKPFHCTMCASSFTTDLLLKRHKLSHPAGTEHICRYCGRLYKQRVILNRHIADKHGERRSCLCVTCGRTYATAVGLAHHRAAQHGTRRAKLDVHVQPPHTAEDASDVPIKKDLDSVGVDAPQELCDPSVVKSERNIMCEICAKTFKHRIELRKHMKSKHMPLECPECGKCFKVRSYYERHVQRHYKTREELKVHSCEYCAYATDKKFLLTCHTRRRHTHVRPYVCELCGKGFYIRREVKLHMSVHTKERPETCTVCGKRFVNKTALLFHTRLHTGERPYPCDVCGERFLSPSRRGAHVRSKHRPRPQCHLCPSTFTDKQVLKKHVRNVHCAGGGGGAGGTETNYISDKQTFDEVFINTM